MAKDDDDEALRRRGRARTRPPPPTSINSMYEPLDATTQPPSRSSKMKMASLMAVVDDESKNKRVKVEDQHSDDWAARNAPISISSLTTSTEAPASSLFQDEMPTIIPSFSREAVFTNGARKRLANGDASPAATRTMFDVYFSSGRNETNGSSGNRSLKRKRRSGRRDELGADVDLLRFGVDATKLVPQGLVDRVDGHMSRAVLVKVVENHVTNWCHRSGFAASFLQELTTLLAAYYPCNYPTLLDEVFAGFLFRRPEFMDFLLPAMLVKMNKAGDSVSTTKYPVADALARMCNSSTTKTESEVARHDLACRSLLRCLVEHNGDMFALSPWLAACAIESSDRVLQILWKALLSCSDAYCNWRIKDANQQIVELLAEEGKLRVCQISCGFVKVILSDDALRKKLVDSQSYLISDCLERAFKYASTSWSTSLMAEWLERRRKEQRNGYNIGGGLKKLVEFFICFNLKLSVKKPEWFVKHVLSFILSFHCHISEQEMALRTILCDHMSTVFGGECTYQSQQNGYKNASVATGDLILNSFDTLGGPPVLEVQRKLKQLIGLLRVANACTSALFLDLWTEAWSGKRISVPWSYVHALINVIIQEVTDSRSELERKLQSLTTSVCRSYCRRLSRCAAEHKPHNEFFINYSKALRLLLPSPHPVAKILLQEVLEALVEFDQEDLTEASLVFGKVVISHLGSWEDVAMDGNVKQSAMRKSLVECDRTLASAATSTVDLLTALHTLASKTAGVGTLTRHVLSTGPVVRLFARLLNSSRRRRRQELLLDVMNVAVSCNISAKLSRNWARQYVVQELVHCAYTGPPLSARKAITLLQNIYRCVSGTHAFMWVVIEQCTRLCCGRKTLEDVDESLFIFDSYQRRADTFAELVKTMVVNVPATTMYEVLSFVEHKLTLCFDGKTQVNLFLLLLLQKLVVCDIQCDCFFPVVQLAVCPLAHSDQANIRLVQLQLLKALCTRSTAVQLRPEVSEAADRRRFRDLIYNERLQSDLRLLLNASCGVYSKVDRTNRASIVLAKCILACTHQLKMQGPIDEDHGASKPEKSRLK